MFFALVGNACVTVSSITIFKINWKLKKDMSFCWYLCDILLVYNDTHHMVFEDNHLPSMHNL